MPWGWIALFVLGIAMPALAGPPAASPKTAAEASTKSNSPGNKTEGKKNQQESANRSAPSGKSTGSASSPGSTSAGTAGPPGSAGKTDAPEGAGKKSGPEGAGKTGAPEAAGRAGAPDGTGKKSGPEGAGKKSGPEGAGKTGTPEGAGKKGAPEAGGKTGVAGSGGSAGASVQRPPGQVSPGQSADPVEAPAGVEGQEGTVRHSALYGDRLDGLQAEVDDLKDRIFRSKARLALLRETVLRGVLAGSRIILAHRNRMGSSFRLVRIVYLLDGAQVYGRTDEGGGLDQEDELVVFDGNLPPGPHTVTIELTYKGHGYGVFSYLNGYTFDSRSTHSFTAPENGAAKVTSTGFERGNLTTEMKDRPSIDWQLTPLDATGKPLPKSAKRRK